MYVQYVEVHVNLHALTLHVPSSVSGNILLCILCCDLSTFHKIINLILHISLSLLYYTDGFRIWLILLFATRLLDSRCKLTRREAELLDSADKVRGTMENQLSDLRKQSASLEHDVTSAREDNKILQQQLREKVSNLQ